MFQVLFRIPLRFADGLPSWWPDSIPIYGFGMMLFITFLVTTWLASRRARKEGINPQHLQDLAVWIFVSGIIGARLVYMEQYGEPLSHFFMIWQGGLVFYGSFAGGVVGYILAYFFVIRKHGLSTWKLADIIAPLVALGLCLGRVGCLLNGCCYGNVACPDCPSIHFPLSAPARYQYVGTGYQTAGGFTFADDRATDACVVGAVVPGSPAAVSGLRPGDRIVAADDQPIHTPADLTNYLVGEWSEPKNRGKKDLTLTVVHAGQTEAETLPTFVPRTLGLHPTQVYESVSMGLLYLLLLAYYPFRRRDGMVLVLFIIGYALHRFLNEMLRNDTDPVAFGMTLSQNGSILFLLSGVLLFVWLWRKPAQYQLRPAS